jgi:hypothetical protein
MQPLNFNVRPSRTQQSEPFMTKRIVALFLCGIATAFASAAWLYSVEPGGMLLYTPPPHGTPHYTPSSFIGFFIAVAGLSCISAIATISFVATGILFRRAFYRLAKHAAILLCGFGLLSAVALASQNLWP